jgi:hypothetical protein
LRISFISIRSEVERRRGRAGAGAGRRKTGRALRHFKYFEETFGMLDRIHSVEFLSLEFTALTHHAILLTKLQLN